MQIDLKEFVLTDNGIKMYNMWHFWTEFFFFYSSLIAKRGEQSFFVLDLLLTRLHFHS